MDLLENRFKHHIVKFQNIKGLGSKIAEKKRKNKRSVDNILEAVYEMGIALKDFKTESFMS